MRNVRKQSINKTISATLSLSKFRNFKQIETLTRIHNSLCLSFTTVHFHKVAPKVMPHFPDVIINWIKYINIKFVIVFISKWAFGNCRRLFSALNTVCEIYFIFTNRFTLIYGDKQSSEKKNCQNLARKNICHLSNMAAFFLMYFSILSIFYVILRRAVVRNKLFLDSHAF